MHLRHTISKPTVFLWLLMIVLSLLLTCCTTYRKCTRKFGVVTDSVTVPVMVVIPRDSIMINYLTDTLKITDTITRTDGRAEVIVYRDSVRTYIKAVCKDSFIYLEAKCPPVVQLKKDSAIDSARGYLIVAFIFIIILAVLIKFLKS
jgi:hypothetical protein